MQSISLVCIAGPLKEKTFRLQGGPVFLFGRYAKATFSLAADPAASHLHFMVDTSENRIRILDLGSTNGLVINDKHMGGKLGQPFTNFVTIKPGDTILAGACLFRLTVQEEVTITGPASLNLPAAAAPKDSAPGGNLTAVIAKEPEEKTPPPAEDPNATVSAMYAEEVLPYVEGFTLLQRIAGGGKGMTYKAIKEDSGAIAAIKMMMFNRSKSKKQRSLEMFRREIQITKQLQHPNIIRYLGDGISQGAPYLAIEYVEGGTLSELIKASPNGKMELPQAVPLFIQLLEAVAYMHGRSLVHRDIKPKNILLDVRRGGSLAVKLSDMGLSCRFTTQEMDDFMPIVSEGGTPAYMPPEQLMDLTRAIPQSDVFSAAATLYQMLTGSLVYDFTAHDDTEAIIKGSIRPVMELRPDLPPELGKVITKALAYAPENRYSSAENLLDAFKKALP